ncbi:MAG: 23S rRNA (adenine(2503)-C(2))-methyltransferase RlmN [Bacteroidetes bacterium]|nr:23S rRNA (adenine(2503)-C(2))-methyltransferase RlmN [Bacteroidota bacterium]
MKNIRSLAKKELEELAIAQGQSAFRGRQLYEWLWKKAVPGFDHMSNMPLPFREFLKENYMIGKVEVDHFQKSKDRTIKNAFKLQDGALIEGVLIPTDSRMTACVSSQVGCSLSCKFCATGRLERMRNLDFYEIYDQVNIINKQAIENYQIPLSNIVYMGMGEPLLNYSNVWKSIEMVTSPEGMGMSPQRITVSTAGIAKMIVKLADDGAKFNLALSLHAANDDKRDKIMPNAKELVAFARKLPTKINIIEYNPIEGGEFQNVKEDKLKRFLQVLESNKLIVNVRRSRGKDIDAACGQLANKG